jgi:hypothetical protein
MPRSSPGPGGTKNMLLVRPTGVVEADMYDTALEQANVLLRLPACAIAVLFFSFLMVLIYCLRCLSSRKAQIGRADGYRYSTEARVAVAEYLRYRNFFITMVESDGVQGLVREICVRADTQKLIMDWLAPETCP